MITFYCISLYTYIFVDVVFYLQISHKVRIRDFFQLIRIRGNIFDPHPCLQWWNFFPLCTPLMDTLNCKRGIALAKLGSLHSVVVPYVPDPVLSPKNKDPRSYFFYRGFFLLLRSVVSAYFPDPIRFRKTKNSDPDLEPTLEK